jgi:hypothetical protein
MLRSKIRRAVLLTAGVVTALAGGGVATTGDTAAAVTRPAHLTSSAPVTVVAQGLNSPRSLVWGPHGHLLVAEAGTGGSECTGTTCFGLTGSISDISTGTPVRIVTGLASLSESGGAAGADGLAYTHHRLYVLEASSSFAIPSGLSPGLTASLRKQLGALLNVTTRGTITPIANPGDIDYMWSDQHKNLAPNDFPEANPYNLIPGPHHGFYLVDAASNTLDYVSPHGDVRVLAFIPNTPAGPNAVPTCVAKGPDGALYIGQLNGGTQASVYRYVPGTGSLRVWRSGFSAITGCGFGSNGDFYVTEFDTAGFPPTGFPAGAVIQLAPDGIRTVLGAGSLVAPQGFLAGPDGSIYVSNYSIFPGSGSTTGQVVKIG